MKKKNLIILLLIPFMVAILGIMTVSLTYQTVDVDISHIEWEYDALEPFKLTNLEKGTRYELKAKGVNAGNYEVSKGNELKWSVRNKDITDETVYAEIIEEDGKVYLNVLAEGNVIVTCTNEKGNISREMTACIYTKGLIMISSAIATSQNNVDDVIYYGTKDIVNNEFVSASFNLTVETIPSDLINSLSISNVTDNINVNLTKKTVEIIKNETSHASFTVEAEDKEIKPFVYEFDTVKDGVNVYTYNDLLRCTNRSGDGEIIVLRKSFESLENAYKKNSNGDYVNELKANNVECFGNYNFNTKKFNFINEIYDFETTYNDEYIKQWNEFARNNSKYSEISNRVNVGLRIQKDFYGNGYTINLHNLTYPYRVIEQTDESGKIHYIPELTSDNLFRGPLPFYVLGDPNNLPLVGAYGQDNIGFYVDGDNITVNDINIKNCDFGDRIDNLDTVGTVIEVSGDNVVIQNSRFSSGKHVLRSYSSNNLVIRNCALSYARNFLYLTGSNEYIPVNGEDLKTFRTMDGSISEQKIKDYFAANKASDGNKVLEEYLYDIPKEKRNGMKNVLLSIQDALSNRIKVNGQYKGSTEIIDCMFYSSGLSSIGVDTLFNGPFLYSALPSTITEMMGSISFEGNQIIPFTPKEISGISYPVEVNITGDTRFYDYKIVSDIDMNGLIMENITKIANSLGEMGYAGTITIDHIFPLKTYLVSLASSNSYNYYDKETGKPYSIIPVAYYGGGANLSKVTFNGLDTERQMQSIKEVDFVESYLNLTTPNGNYVQMMKNLMLKTVTLVTGYEPFKFNFYKGNGYLYGEAPNYIDMTLNAKKYKGEKR